MDITFIYIVQGPVRAHKNRLTENQLESLNAFLEIERNDLINRVSITINQKLLTNKDFIDTFLQVFLLADIFASSKNYQFLIDNRDYEYYLEKYLLAIWIKGYDQSRITKFQNEINIGFKIDLSAFDYESVEQSNRTKNFDELEMLIDNNNSTTFWSKISDLDLSTFESCTCTKNVTDMTMKNYTNMQMYNIWYTEGYNKLKAINL
ncbi:hypothetical protein F8M41_014965 [Gigaspora margarita]|uniref:Uncharacterized protein n=1 Tax=Gigaspora margarita TaxID=4874 RepID=A0A8H3WY59_GIGMA|nr:hypothetical protein F8M41_014965 [Gigaspora margarita]